MSTTAASAPTAAAIDPAIRREILDAARAPVEAFLHQPVRFRVERFKVIGDAAFLLATMQDEHGQRVKFDGTSLADAAVQGFVSQTYAALLKRKDGAWSVVTKAIGPSDVAWEGWNREFAVPPSLFQP